MNIQKELNKLKREKIDVLSRSSNLGIILSPTIRSSIYLNVFRGLGLKFEKFIYFKSSNKQKFEINKKIIINKFKNINKNVFEQIKNEKNLSVINTDKDFSKKFKNLINKSNTDYFIYSGLPGQILPTELLSDKKRILHCHPGKLPNYRGSTTIYYSILNKKKIYFTCIILDQKIDNGKVFYEQEVDIKQNINIDFIFDPFYRAFTIAKGIKYLENFQKKKNNRKDDFEYFVIHPILRLLATKQKNIE